MNIRTATLSLLTVILSSTIMLSVMMPTEARLGEDGIISTTSDDSIEPLDSPPPSYEKEVDNISMIDTMVEKGDRSLTPTYSCEYKYQKEKWSLFKGLKWKDTDFRWCVERKNGASGCFPTTIGENEFWDDDRIKLMSDCRFTSCEDRTDIGTGTCKKDSSYSDWTGTACGGDNFKVYKC